MGMTIEEVIKEMEIEWKIFLEGASLDNPKYREKELADNNECKLVVEANECAIEYLKKYQKIVEIMADKKDDGGVFEMEDSYWLDKISEVLEDGENNN